ncbi:MAG TPA: FTR1 family protein [Candidatus Saccharimonadales bacterium]|nr:FTR1 family protein [Candidatus Saccharimonadales bacterium]
MLATLLISFREFLEAFLIIGVFLGISKKLNLKKEKEIIAAATLGVLVSLLLATATYFFGDRARALFSEKNADILESYLLIFSGFFIAYVVFSLHDVMRRGRGAKLLSAHQKLQNEAFDVSLFLTIMFLVVREGFEVALFTAGVSLFTNFSQNLVGLMLGFFAAAMLCAGTFLAYTKFPIVHAFRITQYLIILLGASLVQNGVTLLLSTRFHIQLSNIISFHLNFLPDAQTVSGHMLQSLLGIDRGFSLPRLAIMVCYALAIYVLFLRQKFSRKSPNI